MRHFDPKVVLKMSPNSFSFFVVREVVRVVVGLVVSVVVRVVVIRVGLVRSNAFVPEVSLPKKNNVFQLVLKGFQSYTYTCSFVCSPFARSCVVYVVVRL